MQVARLKHDSWVISVRYSPDGRLLATGEEHAWSADCGMVPQWCLEAGSADKWIRIFDAASPAKLADN